MRDLRIAIRSLARTPAFTTVVALSLGLGIGATATAFSWVDAFVLRPLPGVPDSDRIMSVFTRGPAGARWSLSYPIGTQWREAVAGDVDLALSQGEQVSLRMESGAERLWAELVTGNFFEVMRVRALAGRTLTPADERSAAPVAVLSERVWSRLFGRDPALVGRQVTINGNGFTIVGIVPARFGGSGVGLANDVWLPVTMLPVLDPGNTALLRAGDQFLDGIARPADGMTLVAARARLEDASRAVAEARGERVPTLAGVRRLSETSAGEFITPLIYTMLGLAAVVLAIAAANIANLFLVRATGRVREMGVRAALGASRWSLIRQLLVESLVVATLGGLVGIVVTLWGRGLLGALMPDLPFPVDLVRDLNARVVVIAAALTVGTAIVVGIAPALRASRPRLVGAIRGDEGRGSPRSLLRSGLVVTQVALSLTALVSAGLFFRSLTRARAADLGFSGLDQILVANTSFRFAGLPDSVSSVRLAQLLDRVRALPGVVEAGVTDDLPVSLGGHSATGMEPDGYQPGPDENRSVDYAQISGGYFDAMDIPILAGRGVLDTDRAGTQRVIVVNQAFVDRYWPDREPLGGVVKSGGRELTVVGVVGNVVLERVGERPAPYVYFPIFQRFENEVTLVLRTGGNPRALIEPTRGAIQSVDPTLPLLDPRTMRDNLAGALFVQSVGANVLAGLGLIALSLASLGLYGVLAFAVSQRRREIGIRMALGAVRSRVIGLVARQAAVLVAIGIAIGTGLAVAVGNLIRSQLFGVEPADPVTFAVVTAILALVGIGAAAIPARQASRVDPVVTLKAE